MCLSGREKLLGGGGGGKLKEGDCLSSGGARDRNMTRGGGPRPTATEKKGIA